jgi:hypothetical protein
MNASESLLESSCKWCECGDNSDFKDDITASIHEKKPVWSFEPDVKTISSHSVLFASDTCLIITNPDTQGMEKI